MMHGQTKQKGETLTQKEIEDREEKGKKILESLKNFFRVRKNEVQQPEDPLQFTELMAKLCPEIATIYNYRREVLQSKFDLLKTQFIETKNLDHYKALIKLIQSEFMLVTILLKQHPKSYTLWTHRQWMVLRSQEIDNFLQEVKGELQIQLIGAIKLEYELCSKMLDRDERNFHVWNYRNWLSSISAYDQEDEFTKKKIEQNFSNFSAYHFRSKFFLKNYNQPIQIIQRIKNEGVLGLLPLPFKRLLEETDLIQQAIFIQPKEHGVFLYQRWLIGVAQPFGIIGVRNITNTTIEIIFNKTISQIEQSINLYINNEQIEIQNIKLNGQIVIIEFKEIQIEEFKIQIKNNIFENQNENTILNQDENSNFFIPVQINGKIKNNILTETDISISQEFQDAIIQIKNYLLNNIDFIKQVIEEEQNNRFPFIQLLYLLKYQWELQILSINSDKFSVAQNITEEAIIYCHKLINIENDHQARFLLELWERHQNYRDLQCI